MIVFMKLKRKKNYKLKKKVCHVVQSYYPRDPRIRRQATSLVEAGYDVDVICLRAEDQEKNEIFEGVNIIRVPLVRKRGKVARYIFEYFAFFVMAFLYLTFHPRKYNIIHISNLPDFLIFSGTIPKLFGTPIILDEHDPMPEIFESRYNIKPGSFISKFVRWQQKISLHFASEVITTTKALADNYKRSVNREVYIIMNLPDDNLFHSEPRIIKNPTDKSFKLVFAGTVTESYNLDLAVSSLPEIKKHIPNVTLTIIGGGPEIANLKKLAKNLTVSDNVIFTGDKPLSTIPDLLKQFDLGISTLKMNAQTYLCFTTKSAEYAAMGLPCLSVKQPTLETYYPDGLIEYFEANTSSFTNGVITLYNNPQRRQEMSDKGRKFIQETFNWSKEKIKYIEIITKFQRK